MDPDELSWRSLELGGREDEGTANSKEALLEGRLGEIE